MSTLTLPTEVTAAGDGTVKAGTVAVGRTFDTGNSVWVYVLLVLDAARVFGVNLGTNSSYLAPEGTGMRFGTFAIDGYTDGQPITRLTGDVPAALVAFLESSPGATGATAEDLDKAREEGRAEVQARWDAWNERATEIAHEYADNNDLCSEFDRCMEEIGLPTRRREYLVTYRVTLPRHSDPWSLDPEDLYNEAEDFTTHNVESV